MLESKETNASPHSSLQGPLLLCMNWMLSVKCVIPCSQETFKSIAVVENRFGITVGLTPALMDTAPPASEATTCV